MRAFNQWYFSLKWWQRGLYALGASSVFAGIWYMVYGEFIVSAVVGSTVAAMLPLK